MVRLEQVPPADVDVTRNQTFESSLASAVGAMIDRE